MPMKIARKNAFAPRKAAMGEMNVTPFIDVLLVLLIMLILAMPIPTHVTSVDMPTPDITPPKQILSENVVAIDSADKLYWNGAQLSAEDLRLQVAAASAMDTQPRLSFAPEPLASYDRSARVIALIREEGAEGFSFSGLSAHKDFGL